MAGITLEIADGRLQQYMAAETAVLSSQAYKIDDREMTRADLDAIRSGIEYWSGWVDKLNPVQRVLPTPRAVGRVRGGRYRMR
ncbi:DUF6148 family protein [Sphingomonadaceae bacterium OTU29THOMA1]|jgi:hypothetical protein|nr:DUF6148 family protein [Sphingomonadaceae bacterium OTU29THOMA1]